jgi:ion channel-forming bestrophin family protein
MVEYDPHRWWSYFHYLRGSMVKEIVGRVLMCVIWSVAVVAFSHHVANVGVPPTVHTLAGISLSLLLVFRTNSSYDRFWEGRKLWGGIVNETRNLMRASEVFIGNTPLFEPLVRWTATFPFATAAWLRGQQRDLGEQAKYLPADQVQETMQAQHVPLSVSRRLTHILNEGRKQGHYPEFVQMQLGENVQLLIDYLGACERIHKTPMPFAYMVHVRRALIMYCFTLPFALVDTFGWVSVFATFVVAYVFFGIEEIGVEIEDPFGTDDNDLPLENISNNIQKNLLAFLPAPPP